MSNKQESYYKRCRKMAGLTQEQASEPIGVEVRRLSDYENGAKVPDDVVGMMADTYDAPLLAIWHMKENSPLGRFLPNVIETQTNNDLGFQTVLAKKDTDKAEGYIVAILEDGQLTIEDMPNVEAYIISIDAAIGKLLSAKAYIEKAKRRLLIEKREID